MFPVSQLVSVYIYHPSVRYTSYCLNIVVMFTSLREFVWFERFIHGWIRSCSYIFAY